MKKLISMFLSIFLMTTVAFAQTDDSGEDKQALVINFDVCECLAEYGKEVCRDAAIRIIEQAQEECQCTVVGLIDWTACEE